MKTPYYPSNLTSQLSLGSVTNLLNPVSFLFKGKQYVPKFMTKLFASTPGSKWNNQGGAARMAHLATKLTLLATVAGLGTWGARALAHSMQIDNIQHMDPSVTAGGKLADRMELPVDSALEYSMKDSRMASSQEDEQKKKKKSVQKKASAAYNLALGSLPTATTLLAMVAAMSIADKHYDRQLGKQLDRDLQAERKKGDQLAKKRIFASRLSQQPALQKTASEDGFFNDTEKAIGLLGAVLATLGVVGGYNWQRSNSRKVVEYKAAKKGLETYNAQKQLASHIDTNPIDPKLMRLFNADLDKYKKHDAVVDEPMKEILI